MDVPQVVDLSSRLHRLEIAVIVLTVLVFALVFFFLSSLASRTLLVLRDRRGNGRIVVGRSEAGDPEITLRGRDSVSWLTMGFDADGGPMLSMSDRSGRTRFALAMFEGGPVFSLGDDEAEPRIFAGFSGDRVPSMSILDRTGKYRIDLSLDESGGPYLMIYDGKATRRLALGISPDDDPALVFYGRQGEERIRLGFDANGVPFLHVLDEEGGCVSHIPAWKTGTGEV